MGNPLKYLVLHCTATPEGREVTRQEIERWHKKNNGWDRLGYHGLIHLDGKFERTHPVNSNNIVEDTERAWGVSWEVNKVAHHICYVGGMNRDYTHAKDTRTLSQKMTLKDVIEYYIDKIEPNIQICGHYHFAAKACPSFNVADFCREIGLENKNIYRG